MEQYIKISEESYSEIKNETISVFKCETGWLVNKAWIMANRPDLAYKKLSIGSAYKSSLGFLCLIIESKNGMYRAVLITNNNEIRKSYIIPAESDFMEEVKIEIFYERFNKLIKEIENDIYFKKV